MDGKNKRESEKGRGKVSIEIVKQMEQAKSDRKKRMKTTIEVE